MPRDVGNNGTQRRQANATCHEQHVLPASRFHRPRRSKRAANADVVSRFVPDQRLGHFADGANRVDELSGDFRIAADRDRHFSCAELGNHAELAGQERRQSALHSRLMVVSV